ncbi:hypothetical protein APHNP_1509 [Anaplasma phagocytophilum str. ApNP]|uniref:Uncharacterized protein n=2 Tax=Anaplasma phagocytophilum TaxID=948 RepID=A0A0F3NEZ7_ANAPH|nr:hypothetical protein APHMUC_1653 [Anaplasma phagocytophilum str. ApMUC09]KJV66272.1 hypothetical protein APHNP_1509 [Anaplasma phagocytophilum str. ApNP]
MLCLQKDTRFRVMHITRYQELQKEKRFCNLCSNLNNKRYDIVLGF